MKKPKSGRSKNRPQRRKPRLFSPTEVMTDLQEALERDLGVSALEYAFTENPRSYGQYRQITEFSKKFGEGGVSPEDRKQLAFDKFLKVNDHMGSVAFEPPVGDRIVSTDNTQVKILKRARALMRWVLDDLSQDEWFTLCKHGSGSSVGVPFTDTSIERKSTWPISLTSGVKPLWDSYCVFDRRSEAAILELNGDAPSLGRYEYVKGSRATTAPKNADIDRFIAVEPTLNMFFQQGLMALMYLKMSDIGLDVRNLPEHHQALARHGSVTGEFATIDWTSASDCVSIELLRYLLPPKWFAALMQVRSPQIRMDEGTYITPSMYATMGNATTFPIETLVFWTLAQAVSASSYRTNSLFPVEYDNLPTEVSVFGDDCIIREEHVDLFIDTCSAVGFIINSEKTHRGCDPFRESCGGDFITGEQCRPVTTKGPSSNRVSALEPWLYNLMNQVKEKYILYFGPDYWFCDRAFFRVAFRWLGRFDLWIKVVPDYFPEDSGFHVSAHMQGLNDWYPGEFSISPVYRNEEPGEGDYSFKFLRFLYWEREEQHQHLRYAFALKTLDTRFDKALRILQELEETFFVRKRGGYIVARGTSSCWHVPTLKD